MVAGLRDYRMKKESMDARESDPASDRICLPS